jgi:hypothetical protein
MNASTLNLIKRKLHEQTLKRAEQLQEIAASQHANAPRGGDALNRYGENRSAPGEPPAPETLELLSRIENGLKETPDAIQVAVNYTVLELGYQKNGRILEPRPNGRLAVEELKRQVSSS